MVDVTDKAPERPSRDLAAIIGDNLMPIAGVLLLGWNATSLVVLYFAGFLVDLAAILVLLLTLDPEGQKIFDEEGKPPVHPVKRNLGFAVVVFVIVGVVGTVLGFPVFVMFAAGGGTPVGELFADPGFLAALALHVLLAAHAHVHTWRRFAREARVNPHFRIVVPARQRFAYVTTRWVAVYAATLLLPIPIAIVIAYCAASIWFAFRPPKPYEPADERSVQGKLPS
jgi:hypothetical protein